MQDIVFLVAYIGFMTTLTCMTLIIINFMRQQQQMQPQNFYFTAGDCVIDAVNNTNDSTDGDDDRSETETESEDENDSVNGAIKRVDETALFIESMIAEEAALAKEDDPTNTEEEENNEKLE